MNCYICEGELKYLGSIPFDSNSQKEPIIDDTPMDYYKCESCSSIFCPEMLTWSPEKFSEKVYNEGYAKIDPDYTGGRAKIHGDSLVEMLRENNAYKKVRHLDYGSGEGHLSKLLINNRWNSHYYDPFSSPNKPEEKFNLITAMEVIEHSTNTYNTIEEIKSYLEPRKGVLIFTTLFCDENTPINWWYIGSRGGHINIMSRKAMQKVARKYDLMLSSFSDSWHSLLPNSNRNAYNELVRGHL